MPEPTLTVAVFVGTRADLGPLAPVLSALSQAGDIDLRVLTGVMYAPAELARALPGPLTPEQWLGRVIALADPMHVLTPEAQAAQGARLAEGTARALREGGIDVLVVLGDRWELLYVVPPATVLGVPVVHLHGGEVTEGALDERVRHAVSKLADQHCVASQDSADRLRRMGEPAERITVTGAPGLDRLATAEPIDAAGLARLVGLARVDHPLALFTYHPPTAVEGAEPGAWARAAAQATLDRCATVVATYPGMDAGREQIIAALQGLARENPERFALVEALGAAYPRALALVDVVVGNSSSGIIEAATVGTPAVNIGQRQHGRLRGAGVIDCAEGYEPVRAALERALTPEWRAHTAASGNPYGDGRASAAILDRVRAAARTPRVKPFAEPGRAGDPAEGKGS